MALLIHFLAFLAVYMATVSLRKLLRYRAYRLLSTTHGYQHPPKEGPYDLLGIFKVIRATRHLLNKTALPNTNALFERYGETYASKVVSQTVFFTCDPRDISMSSLKHFVDYDSSVVSVHLFRPITKHGLSCRYLRLETREGSLSESVCQHSFDYGLQHARETFPKHVTQYSFHGKPFDLQPLFLNLTLNLTTAFAVGESVDSLSPAQSDEKKHFVKALLYVKKIMARNGFLGPVHLLLSKRDFYKACNDVHRCIDCIIKRALDEKQQEGAQKKDPSRYCVLQGLIQNLDIVFKLRDGVITVLMLASTPWLVCSQRPSGSWHETRESIRSFEQVSLIL